jgi:hypothetical protein
MSVNCPHWSENGCALGKFGGKPSLGTCAWCLKHPNGLPRSTMHEFEKGRQVIRSTRSLQRYTVVTFSTNDFAPLANLTAGHNKAWADRNVYGFVNAVGQYSPDCPASWNRMPWYIALCDILPAGSIVFHIDADAVVTNPDFRLEDLVGADDDTGPNGWDMLFPIDHVGRHCGVWLWRVCPSVKALFQRAYERRHVEKNFDYWEQGAITRELEAGDHGVRERWVPQHVLNCWNNWHTVKYGSAKWEPGSNVYHHVGETLGNKLAGIKTILKAAREGKRVKAFKDPCAKAPSPRGLGDVVERVLGSTGVGPLAKKCIEKVTGKPCGCGKRRDKLNRLFTFRPTA